MKLDSAGFVVPPTDGGRSGVQDLIEVTISGNRSNGGYIPRFREG